MWFSLSCGRVFWVLALLVATFLLGRSFAEGLSTSSMARFAPFGEFLSVEERLANGSGTHLGLSVDTVK